MLSLIYSYFCKNINKIYIFFSPFPLPISLRVIDFTQISGWHSQKGEERRVQNTYFSGISFYAILCSFQPLLPGTSFHWRTLLASAEEWFILSSLWESCTFISYRYPWLVPQLPRSEWEPCLLCAPQPILSGPCSLSALPRTPHFQEIIDFTFLTKLRYAWVFWDYPPRQSRC